MEKTITGWMKEVVRIEDERTKYIENRKAELRNKGYRFVGWTGGGNAVDNRFYDEDTREHLLTVEDTLEEFDRVWAENPTWVGEDGILSDSYDLYPSPDMPEEYAFLLDENYEPEDFRTYLEENGL